MRLWTTLVIRSAPRLQDVLASHRRLGQFSPRLDSLALDIYPHGTFRIGDARVQKYACLTWL
jgi:hypothetical protein